MQLLLCVQFLHFSLSWDGALYQFLNCLVDVNIMKCSFWYQSIYSLESAVASVSDLNGSIYEKADNHCIWLGKEKIFSGLEG